MAGKVDASSDDVSVRLDKSLSARRVLCGPAENADAALYNGQLGSAVAAYSLIILAA